MAAWLHEDVERNVPIGGAIPRCRILERTKVTPMPTEPRETRAEQSRIASRQELTHFYRAIGIPAVVSATQAAKMTAPPAHRTSDLPAFLRNAHAVS
jgi:hypothetical protein